MKKRVLTPIPNQPRGVHLRPKMQPRDREAVNSWLSETPRSSHLDAFRHSEQIVEQHSIVNHGLAHVFRRGLPLRVPHRDLVPCPEMLDKEGAVHGKFCGALLEVR